MCRASNAPRSWSGTRPASTGCRLTIGPCQLLRRDARRPEGRRQASRPRREASRPRREASRPRREASRPRRVRARRDRMPVAAATGLSA
ncbi:hypothetical protein DA075_19155 [Methylobacterium currus]|uniref:Uncharacterized protein n=1 Tax=Methylobacterium currus TaxID=2051553 RepID=A0A2R4WMI4_9HYPH|nr:hypothetical protein DA075_19155 [Methylobacterium currus]